MVMPDRALVFDIIRYLDRVAFVPRDLVLAYRGGSVGAEAFDRYRATAEAVTGPIREPIWAAVLAELVARAAGSHADRPAAS